jgi:hypothetical protein
MQFPKQQMRIASRMFAAMREQRVDWMIPAVFSILTLILADDVITWLVAQCSREAAASWAAWHPPVRPHAVGAALALLLLAAGFRPHWQAAKRSLQAGVAILALLLAGPAHAAPDGQPTGLIPATPEQLRGIPLASTPFSGAELPTSVDLSSQMPPPQHQGALQSCTAWSLAYAVKSYQEQVEERRPFYAADGRLDPQRIFSPAFLFNQLNNGRNAGVPFVEGFRVLRDVGAAPWSLMPYDGADFTSRPSDEAFRAARRFRIDFWRQVNVQDPREIKAQLDAGYPVIFGAKLDPSFESAAPGFVWRETAPGPCGGGDCGYHAMVLVGYDDARRAFKLINSWGTQWGDGGYGWVDYNHFGRVSSEAYVAKDARNDPPGPDEITQNPTPRRIEFTLTGVTHNAVMPDRPQDGYFLRIDGALLIPGGAGSFDQVAIGFWYDGGGGTKGQIVPGAAHEYTTVHGQAACGTARYPVPPQGVSTTWAAWIPYAMLAAPPGAYFDGPAGPVYQARTTALVAEAVLYLDNFGVAVAPLVPFTITR